ncbi:MAG: 50S ribosomal protein L9 [Gemmatimonadota bacterium]|jgi:large subunit ribosomal protein L9
MQIILLKEMENLGDVGDLVDVKAGYARNFLVPRGFAIKATKANIARIDEEREHLVAAAARELDRATALAGDIEGQSLNFPVKAGEDGRLFGSVSSADIAAALADKGVEVDRRDIQLAEPIKQLGTYKVPVRLSADVQPEVTVWVVAEEDE